MKKRSLAPYAFAHSRKQESGFILRNIALCDKIFILKELEYNYSYQWVFCIYKFMKVVWYLTVFLMCKAMTDLIIFIFKLILKVLGKNPTNELQKNGLNQLLFSPVHFYSKPRRLKSLPKEISHS